MSNSKKFRELLEKEKFLQRQLNDCETAQSRMLKKAFKGLELKVGCFGEMIGDQSHIAIINVTGYSVIYCRYTGIQIETCEITFEDLFVEEAS